MKDESKKYLKLSIALAGALSFCIVLYFIILRFSDVSNAFEAINAILEPFFYGAVIAYLLAPLCRRLEELFFKAFKTKKQGIVKGIATFCSLLIGLGIITLIFLLIIPSLTNSISGLVQTLPSQIDKAVKYLREEIRNEPDILQTLNTETTTVVERLKEWLSNVALPDLQSIGLSIADRVASVVIVIKNVLLGFIIALYLLLNREQFLAQAKLCLRSIFSERWYQIVTGELAYADKMFNGFFIGKLKDSAIVGIICFIGCLILGYDSPLLIAVIVGVTNIIPFFGPFIGVVPCALLLVLENPMHCLTFLIFFIILVAVDGNIIGPKILGDTTGLSSFWVLFSILFFGGLWGLTGMIIGVPLFAVIYDVTRRLVYKSLNKKGEKKMIKDYQQTFKQDT